MNDEYDFIAVGDTVTDAFIDIKQANVYKDHDVDGDGTPNEELCFLNGAKIPFEKVTVIPAVGNSANAAVSAVRLGLKTAFATDIGNDDHGKEILETLKKPDTVHILGNTRDWYRVSTKTGYTGFVHKSLIGALQ